jgi:hypothetical protein
VDRLNESLSALFGKGNGSLERDLRATLSAQASSLEDASGRTLRVEEGPVPQLQLDSERLQNLLTTVRSPAELSTFLSGLGAFAQALPGALARSDEAQAAADRAEELRVGATRETLQIQPGTAEAIGRLVAHRVQAVLESATTVEPEDKKRKPAPVSEKARKAYGLPAATPRRAGFAHEPSGGGESSVGRGESSVISHQSSGSARRSALLDLTTED